MSYEIFSIDPSLLAYKTQITQRRNHYLTRRKDLLGSLHSLTDFANGASFFGFQKTKNGWYFREWAPAADAVYLMGDFNHWNPNATPLHPIGNGVFEVFLPNTNTLFDGCHVKVVLSHNGRLLQRNPSYIHRVAQDKDNGSWCGMVTDEPNYLWKNKKHTPKSPLLIYECHIGMAQEKEGVGTYREFKENILPYIQSQGYNTIQLMAIMEHPYYASFGYQVSSFFAPCSRYGTANELKELIDTAHTMGITVLLDVVHSHAIKNPVEGLSEFDGTDFQYFHHGQRGEHPAWGTRLFHYGKTEVLHFLLSNLKYWMTEFHFDGFRFDGVTSMIYHDHGLGTAFTNYNKYFSENTDLDALTYLQLANELIKEINPDAITIAEDMSAMPGMCLPLALGGIGFNYRLAMGQPDLWIDLVENHRDEDWNMWHIWHELTNRRPKEPYISYAESHDQALVGDKTLIFRLCDKEMYADMEKGSQNPIIDRGIALHKLIRFASFTIGGEGYLNFMGNEFGHPEWIDFPRDGNQWSHFYCRRQWSLAKSPFLRYENLLHFDRALLSLSSYKNLLAKPAKCLCIDDEKKVLVYERQNMIFAINFHPTQSYDSYTLPVVSKGKYQVILSTDDDEFGGWNRISKDFIYCAKKEKGQENAHFSIYLPARTALCLKKI